MAERIVKRELAREGDAVEVQARNDLAEAELAAQQPDDTGDSEGGEAAQAALADAAASEAQRILSEAEHNRMRLLEDVSGEIEQQKEQWQAEQARQKAEFEAEMDRRREQLEKETRAQIEATYRERYDAAARTLESLATEMRHRQGEFLESTEKAAFELTLEIARALIRQDLRKSKQAITRLIAQAFELLKPEKVMTVRVNPATFHLLLEDELFKAELGDAGIRLDSIDLEIDENMAADQFVAEVVNGRIEFDLELVLDEMIAQLSERRQAAATDATAADEDE